METRQLLLLVVTAVLWIHSVTMATEEQVVTYDGDKLITVDVPAEGSWLEARGVIHSAAKQGFDIWRGPSISAHADKSATTAHVHVSEHDVMNVLSSLADRGFPAEVAIHDIGGLITEQNKAASRRRKKRDVFDINYHYARYDEILDWMDSVAQAHPEVARVEKIGKTHEGREIPILKLGEPRPGKWGIWVDGGIHAREWISSSTVIYLAQQLIEGYKNRDVTVTSYLKQLDWFLLPVMNPDGHEYTHTINRLWRKNRHPSSHPNCTGVDLNRNWGYKWGGADSDSRPCDDMYRGRYPESEREVRAVVDFLVPRADAVIAYLSYHSYGHKILTPWAYTERELPPDHTDLIDLAERATDAIRRVHGVSYTAGTAPQLIYPFSGGSADWAKGVANIKYSYLLEIRDDGRYGFLLPPQQIVPTGEEHWAGVRVIAEDILKNYGEVPAPEVEHKPEVVQLNRIVLLNRSSAFGVELATLIMTGTHFMVNLYYT